jgi:hypothetical protein
MEHEVPQKPDADVGGSPSVAGGEVDPRNNNINCWTLPRILVTKGGSECEAYCTHSSPVD